MSDGTSGSGDRDAELRARLGRLSGAIKAEQKQADEGQAAAGRTGDAGVGKAMATGFRVASELLGGVLVGAFIGWWLDHWLGTRPVFLLVLTLLGVVAGFWNVYRFTTRPTGGPSDGGK